MRGLEFQQELENNLEQLLQGLSVIGVQKDVPLGKSKPSIRADMLVTIKIGTQRRKVVFELKQRSFPRELEPGIAQLKRLIEMRPEWIPVLAAPFLSKSGRDLLRKNAINYLDLSGNSYLAFDHVLINKESLGNVYKHKKDSINIFSDKASLLLRELLTTTQEHSTVRTLAGATGSSVGWTSEVLRELEERGYLERKPGQGFRLRRLEYLLNDWTDSYAFLAKNKAKHYFIKADGLDEILGLIKQLEIADYLDYALTLHSAAHLVAPFVYFNECHLYLDPANGFDRQLDFFTSALGLEERETGGNFHIIKPFYRKGAFFQKRSIRGLRLVSDLQLYLDLFNFPIRGREQAEKVFDRSSLSKLQGSV